MSERSTFEIVSRDVDHTVQIGRHLGTLLNAGDVLCLSGNLGAGKTALTRGIGAGWGAQERVTSPTFTLIHEHHRAADHTVLYHIDCYRLQSADDAWGIGLEDLLHSDGISVIEWPENVAGALPADRLWIAFDFLDDNRRHLTLHASGTRYVTLLGALRANLSPNTP